MLSHLDAEPRLFYCYVMAMSIIACMPTSNALPVHVLATGTSIRGVTGMRYRVVGETYRVSFHICSRKMWNVILLSEPRV